MSRSQMRESIYPTVSYDFLSSLEDCVTTTRECTVSLGLGLEKLDKGTGNLPRLGRVLNNRHVRPSSSPQVLFIPDAALALSRPSPTHYFGPPLIRIILHGPADRNPHLEG